MQISIMEGQRLPLHSFEPRGQERTSDPCGKYREGVQEMANVQEMAIVPQLTVFVLGHFKRKPCNKIGLQ